MRPRNSQGGMCKRTPENEAKSASRRTAAGHAEASYRRRIQSSSIHTWSFRNCPRVVSCALMNFGHQDGATSSAGHGESGIEPVKP